MLGSDVSSHILYGQEDSLLVLCGTEDEARVLEGTIREKPYYGLTVFTSTSVPLFYRYQTSAQKEHAELEDPSVVNDLVASCDAASDATRMAELMEQRILLGPTWTVSAIPSPHITAFVGISLKGRSYELQPGDLLRTLLRDPVLKVCLVHLFEIDRGLPYHCLACLSCRSMDELDRATNGIGFARVGRLGMEGKTLVVSSGQESLPTVTSRRMVGIAPAPDIGYLESIASQIIASSGNEVVAAFNELSGLTQLALLRSLAELRQQVEKQEWDEERETGIRSAIDSFTRSALQDSDSIRMAGPVLEMTTTVEGLMKHGLRRIVESVYAKDYSRAQNELKLPTRDFRKISLGKLVYALHEVKRHPGFATLESALEADWLDRLEDFANLRNKWAHGATWKTYTRERVIDEAGRVLVEGIELIRWFGGSVLPVLGDRTESDSVEAHPLADLPESREKRGFGIFLSHSTKDKDVAERIARGLEACNFPVWYDDWAIAPSESIVEKIGEGLARNDTLVVLLSPNSVGSRWVCRELSTALMAQLSGYDVTVVPILLEQCDIPTVLGDIKYIDMSHDFQDGFVKLLSHLRKRLKSIEQQSGNVHPPS